MLFEEPDLNFLLGADEFEVVLVGVGSSWREVLFLLFKLLFLFLLLLLFALCFSHRVFVSFCCIIINEGGLRRGYAIGSRSLSSFISSMSCLRWIPIWAFSSNNLALAFTSSS